VTRRNQAVGRNPKMNRVDCQTYLDSLCIDYHVPEDLRPALKFRKVLGKGKFAGWFNYDNNTISLALDFLQEHDDSNLFKNNGDFDVRKVIRHEFGHFLQKLKGSPKNRYAEAEARLFAARHNFEVFSAYQEDKLKQEKLESFFQKASEE
jgi:hypothetical protein